MGRQIEILATYQDVYEILNYIKKHSGISFIRVIRTNNTVEEVPLDAPPERPRWSIYLTTLPLEELRHRNKTEIGAFLDRTVEMSPSFQYRDSSANLPVRNSGRVFVQTQIFYELQLPEMLRLYQEIVKYIKKNSVHYKHRTNRFVTYILPEAEKLLPLCPNLLH